jgi:hypothetical protein
MKHLKFALASGVLIAGIVLSSTVSFAKPEYSKKEKKPCTACHVKTGAKELNDTGNYYKEHKELPKQ